MFICLKIEINKDSLDIYILDTQYKTALETHRQYVRLNKTTAQYDFNK